MNPRCILAVRGCKKGLGSFSIMEIEWIYYCNLLYEEELTEPSSKVHMRVKRESKWMTQTGDTNQLISNSDYIYMPSCLSHLYFSLWGYYQLDLDVLCSLRTLLETLQRLKGFIISLDMQYSNVAWKLNWTGNHLCILRPMSAHSKWITGGLSLSLRHPILNVDRK